MDIEKYFAYFHDGSVIDMQLVDQNLVIGIESAQISPTDVNGIELSNFSTLKGKLNLLNVKKMYVNDSVAVDVQSLYDSSSILDLELAEHKQSLYLSLIWKNYTSSPVEATLPCSYRFDFEKLFWQSIPDYPDRFNPSINPIVNLFTNGTLYTMERKNDRVMMRMESRVIAPNGQLEFQLSERNTLRGHLVMDWVTSVVLREGEYSNLHNVVFKIVSLSIRLHDLSLIVTHPITQSTTIISISFGAIDWINLPQERVIGLPKNTPGVILKPDSNIEF